MLLTHGLEKNLTLHLQVFPVGVAQSPGLHHRCRVRTEMWKTACIAVLLFPALPAGFSDGAQSQAQSAQTTVKEKPAPPTPLAEQKAELGDDETWDPTWDKVVEDALPHELLFSSKVAKDVRAFCPRFRQMSEADKRAYWAYFFQALAGAEAGLRPTADVRHTEPEVAVKDDVTHRMVRSRRFAPTDLRRCRTLQL